MSVSDANLLRFHLQILHGITVKSFERKRDRLSFGGTKIFGVPLENLPRRYIPEFGLVPCFLVDACSFLLERVGTVGLFRKPGALPRIKNLRAKLNSGQCGLSGSPSYDVATLIKQFCRELPDPLFPIELHAALLKAQALTSVQDRTSALQLLSCLLPARNFSCLHYLFSFLSTVSQRCSENLMTTSNLATVFVPCLLPPPDKNEMSEGRLELRVLVLSTFIEKPHLFGVIPKAVMDSMEFLMDFPFPKKAHSKKAQRKRHSFKVIRSAKTMPWTQAMSKATPAVSEASEVSTSGGKQALRRSFGSAKFPNILLFRTCMPCSDEGFRATRGELGDSSPAVSSKMPQERLLRRDLRLGQWFSGREAADSAATLTSVGKLQLTPWRRRSSL